MRGKDRGPGHGRDQVYLQEYYKKQNNNVQKKQTKNKPEYNKTNNITFADTRHTRMQEGREENRRHVRSRVDSRQVCSHAQRIRCIRIINKCKQKYAKIKQKMTPTARSQAHNTQVDSQRVSRSARTSLGRCASTRNVRKSKVYKEKRK